MHNGVFNLLYNRFLLYNTCWEDPAVDRQALKITPDDTLLVITSAGCNVLDYALAEPRAIYAVDANPRQTALLELKQAAIRSLDFDTFFRIFGEGHLANFSHVFQQKLRPHLSPFAQRYWHRHCHWFDGGGWRGNFFWHGLAGLFARLFRIYASSRPGLVDALREILAARGLEEQFRIYSERIEPVLWTKGIDWALRRPVTMSLLGIPFSQRRQIQENPEGDLPNYVRKVLRHVFRNVPIQGNYFWSVYIRGQYTRECCPEYLKENNFRALKAGLVDRIHPRTCTVTDFLASCDVEFTRYVLLDHMDWLDGHAPQALADEWEFILRRASPTARVIFRSGAERPKFLQQILVRNREARLVPLTDALVFHPKLAEELHQLDRVCTYASFHIADIPAA
jgi:S-adenosylmethionine-diacylglycerol 3-amino-3-carboxypropyl transferase